MLKLIGFLQPQLIEIDKLNKLIDDVSEEAGKIVISAKKYTEEMLKFEQILKSNKELINQARSWLKQAPK